jgi:G3E family GTPase
MSELARRPPPPFPLTVITGFLGAGKTTLLNRLLKDPALADTLVIINEFGEIGLDHLLIEKIDSDMILLSSGCLCCTIRGDLIETLEDLLRRRDNDRIAPFKRVIIETTGLADPAPILQTIMFHPYLMLRFRLEGVITLIDALTGAATLDAHEEAVKQAAVADRLVLTKTDLVPEADQSALAALRLRLGELNPGALQLDAAAGEATAGRLLDAGLYDIDGKAPNVRQWLNAEAFDAGPKHHDHDHGDHAHDHHEHGRHASAYHHDVNRHDARIAAFCLRFAPPVEAAGLDLFLELMRNAYGANLLRLKAIVALADDPARPLILHGVQHIFHAPQRLDAWPDEDRTTRMVFILKDMEPGFVEGLWNAAMGIPAPDRADRQALTDNPLAAKQGGLLS